jgi:hypothetical protein
MLTEIIDTLSDDTKSLTTPLLKVKVLATRIGNESLLKWVNNELDGYKTSDSVPEYRKAKGNPRGNIRQGYYQEENVTLPLLIFGEKIAKRLVQFPLDQGVKALESIATGESGDTMVKQYGADFCAFLTDAARKNGQSVEVTHAWTEVHVSEVIQSLSEIRNKLLELLLEVEKEYPNFDNDIKSNKVDKSQVNQTIVTIMNTFNTSGDGNVVNTGRNNTFNVNVTINKGDIQALKGALKQISIPDADIIELEEIVKADKPDNDKKVLGQKTNGWIQKMVGKTLDKSWDFATGTAAGLLTELLKNYFGL